MSKDKLDPAGQIVFPGTVIPGFRTQLAVEKGVEKNLLFKTWGGLGDQICAEPTLRHAIKMFKGCDISLATEKPELFRHLKFKRVFDLNQERPVYENYLVFNTIVPPTDIVWQFMSHMLTHCVDFPSLCALRCQLPVAEREVRLEPQEPTEKCDVPKNAVFVHAGRHWPSKTFPKAWWDEVLANLLLEGCTPVLIGGDSDDNRGTVSVETVGCIDLRNKISINDSIWYLKKAKVLLTNDSAPLHMAAAGEAWIGFVATCKHPDFISHWRRGEWSWRMKNFGLGGVWEIIDNCPNKEQEVTAEFVEESQLKQWLPDAKELSKWASEKALS